MNIKSILLSAGLAMAGVLPVQAAQHDWHVLNFANGECVRSSSLGWPTPFVAHQAIRGIGKVDNLQEFKDDKGDLIGIEISVPSDHVTWDYFPSLANCQMVRTKLRAAGMLPAEEDLR